MMNVLCLSVAIAIQTGEMTACDGDTCVNPRGLLTDAAAQHTPDGSLLQTQHAAKYATATREELLATLLEKEALLAALLEKDAGGTPSDPDFDRRKVLSEYAGIEYERCPAKYNCADETVRHLDEKGRVICETVPAHWTADGRPELDTEEDKALPKGWIRCT